jgi:hypothetical protein
MAMSGIKFAQMISQILDSHKDDPKLFETLQVAINTHQQLQNEELVTWTERMAIATGIMAIFTALMAIATFLAVIITWIKP